MRSGKRIILIVFLLYAGRVLPAAFAQEGYAFTSKDRDPFMPLVSKSGQLLLKQEIDATGLRLQGIIYAVGRSVAIINDQVLPEGGAIGDYVISTIEQKQVILKKDSEEFILKLEEA
ncbi:MAG: hypothetical protein ABH865_06500 [Candidatus Omnitrophota bacterium]